MSKQKYDDPYVVMATAFGQEKQQISNPMDKDSAEALANNIKDAMKDLDKDFQVFKNVTVSKYTPEDIYAFKDKKDPYNYSVLDSLDKIIKSEKKK